MMKFKRNGGVLFLDETSKDRWFDAYKYKIFNSRDTICLIIEEQYKIFKKTYIDYEETNVMYEDSELNNDSFYVKVKSKDERKA